MKGWISLHRQIESNPLWLLEPFSKAQAWIDLILNANHKDGHFFVRGVKIEIKRGQIGWSEVTMANRWKWSRNKVRRFLKYLEREQQVEQQKVDKITSITTIKNYSKYQNDTTKRQQTKQQTKHKQQCKQWKQYNSEAKASAEDIKNSKNENMWNNIPNDQPDAFVDLDGDGTTQGEKKPSTKKYPNAPIVRGLFKEILSRNPANWKVNKAQLQACENLYTERGVDKIRNALEFYKEHQDDEFCPTIDSPYDLDAKYIKLSRFKNNL